MIEIAQHGYKSLPSVLFCASTLEHNIFAVQEAFYLRMPSTAFFLPILLSRYVIK